MSVELLLCEDNPGDIYLIEDSFAKSKTHYIINKLTDGADVMGYLRQENQYKDATRPDIVILDVTSSLVENEGFLTSRLGFTARRHHLSTLLISSISSDSPI